MVICDLGFGVWEFTVDRQLGPDDRPESSLLRGFMESRRAVDAVGIDERQRGISQRRGAFDERFGQRRSLEEAECRRGVELDVHDSIDHALDKPFRLHLPGGGHAFMEQAVGHAIRKRNIPFIAIPFL